MSNIYCSNCGVKHQIGSKFCTNCGTSLGGFNNMPKSNARPLVVNNVNSRNTEVDEDGIPTTFVRPSKLSYEIEKPVGNRYSGKDLLTAAPLDPSERTVSRPNSNYRRLSKEEFLSQSLKECSSRPSQDIDES